MKQLKSKTFEGITVKSSTCFHIDWQDDNVSVPILADIDTYTVKEACE